MSDTTHHATQAMRAFHAAACAQLSIAPEQRGAQAAVRKRLGVPQSRYSEALAGKRVSLDLVADYLWRWNLGAGVELEMVTNGNEPPVVQVKRG